MPTRTKQRYDRLNVAFPILEHYAKHYTAGGLAAEQAIGVLALFLKHEHLATMLLSTYTSGQVYGATRLVDDLLVPRKLGPWERAAFLADAHREIAPIQVMEERPGLAYEDEERIRLLVYPTRQENPRTCSWRLECHERNEHHLALKQVGECLRRVLEGEKIEIGDMRLQFI